MKKYKSSKYNYMIKEADKNIMINLFTNSAVQILSNQLETITKILANPNSKTLNKDELKFKQILITQGFLINQKLNEVELLKLKNRITRYGNNTLGLVITPTLKCNFKCPYCYETQTDDVMTDSLADNIIKYIKSEAKNNKNLVVTWFGGEPLLELKRIIHLSEQIMSISEKHNVKYNAKIISNGYLLNKDVVNKLIECNCKEIQITIDGPKYIHDNRRILKNGKGSFDKIMENLKYAVSKFDVVKIRVNIDNENAEHIHFLLDTLTPLKEKIYIGFMTVSKTNSYSDKCCSMKEFSEVNSKIFNEAIDRGFKLLRYMSSTPGTVFCGANQIKNMVIDPVGQIYTCLVDVGKESRMIGKLNSTGSIDFNFSEMLKWHTWEPFDNEECIECEVLPICMGDVKGFNTQKKNVS